MKKFIQPAAGTALVLTVPVLAVMGFQFLAKQELGLSMPSHQDVKVASIDGKYSGCCCAYCMQAKQ